MKKVINIKYFIFPSTQQTYSLITGNTILENKKSILDYGGVLLYEESGVDVSNSITLKRKMDIPSYIKAGEYLIVAFIEYKDGNVAVVSKFQVNEKEVPFQQFSIWYILLLLLLVFFIIYFTRKKVYRTEYYEYLQESEKIQYIKKSKRKKTKKIRQLKKIFQKLKLDAFYKQAKKKMKSYLKKIPGLR